MHGLPSARPLAGAAMVSHGAGPPGGRSAHPHRDWPRAQKSAWEAWAPDAAWLGRQACGLRLQHRGHGHREEDRGHDGRVNYALVRDEERAPWLRPHCPYTDLACAADPSSRPGLWSPDGSMGRPGGRANATIGRGRSVSVGELLRSETASDVAFDSEVDRAGRARSREEHVAWCRCAFRRTTLARRYIVEA